jgi:hypothetical protein
MELSSQPARIGEQIPVVHAVTKHSRSQVISWTDTLSLLPWVMLMLLNNMQWWWQWKPYHQFSWELGDASSNMLSQSSAAASWDCLADTFASPPLAMSMLLNDMQWWWSCHHSQQGLDGNTPWYMPSQSLVAAKLVAGLILCLYFLEQCWCSSTKCNDDVNWIAIPSHPLRIGWHILQYAVD